MKITHDKRHVDEQIDYMALIEELQEQYDSIFWNVIDNEMFIYRPLGRQEYKELLSSDADELQKEDAVCETCILYPENIVLDDYPAGIPSQLFALILKNSFLDSIDSKKSVVSYFRREMEEFDNQITCIINEAFPNIDIEEIENWDMTKTAKYLSRAEWKLNVLRQVPVDYELSNQLMEHEWNSQHQKASQDNDIQHEEPVAENKHQDEFKVETLEQRQARLAKEGPKKKSPEELARLKAMFPEIRWDAEIDPTGDLDKMKDSLDVIAPALRPGF